MDVEVRRAAEALLREDLVHRRWVAAAAASRRQCRTEPRVVPHAQTVWFLRDLHPARDVLLQEHLLGVAAALLAVLHQTA